MTVEPQRRRLTPQEHRWAQIYGEIGDRYGDLPATVGVPRMAVRLLINRHGLEQTLSALLVFGVPWMAAKARLEIVKRHDFLIHMLADFPPADPADGEHAIEEMAEDLAAIDCPEGGMRLLRLLERIRNREVWVQAKAKKGAVH